MPAAVPVAVIGVPAKGFQKCIDSLRRPQRSIPFRKRVLFFFGDCRQISSAILNTAQMQDEGGGANESAPGWGKGSKGGTWKKKKMETLKDRSASLKGGFSSLRHR